jgi:hypothetical protein
MQCCSEHLAEKLNLGSQFGPVIWLWKLNIVELYNTLLKVWYKDLWNSLSKHAVALARSLHELVWGILQEIVAYK